MRHKKSILHQERMDKTQLIEEKGGQDGLEACDCGFFVNWIQRKRHQSGSAHKIYVLLRLEPGTTICPECNLAYSGSLNQHKSDTNHTLNGTRKLRFLNQDKMIP